MNSLKELFGDNNPCKDCIIQTMCNKSMLDDTACDKLQKAVLKVLDNELKLAYYKEYEKKWGKESENKN